MQVIIRRLLRSERAIYRDALSARIQFAAENQRERRSPGALFAVHCSLLCANTRGIHVGRNGGWLSRRLRWKESRILRETKNVGRTQERTIATTTRIRGVGVFFSTSFERREGRRVREVKNNEPTPLLRDSFVYIKIDGERKSFSGENIYI